MLLKIISAVLGFATIPSVILLIIGMVEVGKIVGALVGALDLPVGQYWAGFFALIGTAIVAGCIFGFIEA